MLSDWESHNIPPFKLPDMSPRHAPETLFRPHTVTEHRISAGSIRGSGIAIVTLGSHGSTTLSPRW
ncbi:Uncharacterised protein [Mycobacteroides abscessus subsp. abscessus]|nr:Uncharacterised protein [Mycobacteroides abscessus subsp. abscessus]SKR67386.1 Uncharacterised protein [Mycobacteroides abscessus subsp. abscessus]SKR85307.1 Uncharacterised protein [Mycobacteroides abscessus subsp. abscessus]SKT26530.1 Uncharacterised protein [Mycobacteroides abscessus subsp. abscessus]